MTGGTASSAPLRPRMPAPPSPKRFSRQAGALKSGNIGVFDPLAFACGGTGA